MWNKFHACQYFYLLIDKVLTFIAKCEIVLTYMIQKKAIMNFLTVEEVAQKLKMHPTSIRRAIKKGKIYASRPGVGKRTPYRIAESELERIHLQGMCENKK